MKSLSIKKRFPVITYQSSVDHYTPRKPTVIERMIMRLIQDYREDPVISNSSILSVFENQLGLSQASDLVKPSMDDLNILGLFKKYQTAEKNITVQQLELSEQGKSFYQKNELPVKSKTEQVYHQYDFAGNQWSSFNENTLFMGDINEESIQDNMQFRPLDAHHQIKKILEQKKEQKKNLWMTETTKIRSVRSDVTNVSYIDQMFLLSIDRNANLMLRTKYENTHLQKWISQAESDYIEKEMIRPGLMLDKTIHHLLNKNNMLVMPVLSTKRIEKSAMCCPVNDIELENILQSCLSDNYALTIGFEYHPAIGSLEQLTLIVRSKAQTKQKNEQITCALPELCHQLPSDLLFLALSLSGVPTAFFLGKTELYWSGKKINGYVITQQSDDEVNALWCEIEGALSGNIISSEAPDFFAINLLWKNHETVINQWLVKNQQHELPEFLVAAYALKKSINRINNVKNPLNEQWKLFLLNVLKNKLINQKVLFTYSELVQLIRQINTLFPEYHVILNELILNKSQPIVNENNLSELRQIIGRKVNFKKTLIDNKLIMFWMSKIVVGDICQLSAPHEWIKEMTQIKNAYKAIMKTIGFSALNCAIEYKYLEGAVTKKSLDSAQYWIDLMNRFRSVTAGSPYPEKLTKFNLKVVTWKGLVDYLLAEPLPVVNNQQDQWLVFDTNALLDYPGLLDKSYQNKHIAIPMKVLDELDHIKQTKKSDKSSIIAQKVIKKIDQLADRITSIAHTSELLSAEHKTNYTSDDLIISASRTLMLSPVLLITSDINVRNKARAQGLEVIKTVDFVKQNAVFLLKKTDLDSNFCRKTV